MPEPRDTHDPNRAPTPSPQTQRLGALVGRWRSEGHIVGDPPVPITGTDIYEWLPGGFFLVHHVDVVIGDQQVQAIGVWTFTGGGDVAAVARPDSADAGGAVRSTLTISPDRDGMTAKWERSDDGASWQPWMDMTFTRMR
jgi:hypothetical protein